jgi:hypothetical protein
MQCSLVGTIPLSRYQDKYNNSCIGIWVTRAPHNSPRFQFQINIAHETETSSSTVMNPIMMVTTPHPAPNDGVAQPKKKTPLTMRTVDGGLISRRMMVRYGIVYVNSTTRWMNMRNALPITNLAAATCFLLPFLSLRQ